VVNSGDHEGNLKIPLPSNPSHPATESLICPGVAKYLTELMLLSYMDKEVAN